MKAIGKYSKLLGIIGLTVTLFSSCGKNNVVNSNTGSSSNALINSNSAFSSAYQNIKNKYQCLPGRSRLAADYTFYTSGGMPSQSTIMGQFSSTSNISGTASEVYFGVSAFGDVLAVAKATSGGTITGYSVTLSMCSVPNNSYSNLPPLISNDRQITNFALYSPIVLSANSGCGFGQVTSANTYAQSMPIPNNPNTLAWGFQTIFYGVPCF